MEPPEKILTQKIPRPSFDLIITVCQISIVIFQLEVPQPDMPWDPSNAKFAHPWFNTPMIKSGHWGSVWPRDLKFIIFVISQFLTNLLRISRVTSLFNGHPRPWARKHCLLCLHYCYGLALSIFGWDWYTYSLDQNLEPGSHNLAIKF